MQSIFRLPWCSDPFAGDKQDLAALQRSRQATVVDIPLLNQLKRKRLGTSELFHDRDIKRKRPCENTPHLPQHAKTTQGSHMSRQAPTAAPIPSPDHADAQTTTADSPAKMQRDDGAPLAKTTIVASALTPLQQVIEQNFNLEILKKHRELRLIDQELAKCQVALEQLRRCEIIPFPGSAGMSSELSFGTGPAIRAHDGYTQPMAPSAWGVVDGPYSKHYSSWLLPDATFDSTATSQHMVPQDLSAVRSDGRSTRNSGVTLKPTKRSHRESICAPFPQTATIPTPRNKNGPLILKRLSDNQFVKLVCTKCHRSDFSSVQGFLNHCRIAHKIDYKSHESAAQDCGHLLEDHETDLAASAPPPVGTVVKTPAPKPIAAAATPVIGRVHHLNQNILPRPTWKRQRLAYIQALKLQSSVPSSSQLVGTPTVRDPSLVPSASTPFLSAQLARRGIGGDLAAVVARCCEKIELDQDVNEEVDDSQSSISPSSIVLGGKRMLGPIERVPSRKGFNEDGQRPRPAPLAASLDSSMCSAEVPESPRDSLSPHTADSDPGLVSDHDDDDAASDPEDAGSVIVSADSIPIHGGCGDEMDIELDVDDDGEGHAVIIRTRGSRQEDTDMHDAGSPSRPRGKFGRGN